MDLQASKYILFTLGGWRRENAAEPNSKKRKLFQNVVEKNDPLPEEIRHIRVSEQKVRYVFYNTVANLSGRGLSINEACSAVIEVGNTMFGRRWNYPGESDDIIDTDTLPKNRNVRTALQQIEVQSWSLFVEALEAEKQKGRIITHTSDSKIKKGVGQFMVQGLHIGQDSPYPLPLLPIHGEKTEDIALQVDMGFEILAGVKGVSAKEIYKLVDWGGHTLPIFEPVLNPSEEEWKSVFYRLQMANIDIM